MKVSFLSLGMCCLGVFIQGILPYPKVRLVPSKPFFVTWTDLSYCILKHTVFYTRKGGKWQLKVLCIIVGKWWNLMMGYIEEMLPLTKAHLFCLGALVVLDPASSFQYCVSSSYFLSRHILHSCPVYSLAAFMLFPLSLFHSRTKFIAATTWQE